VSDDETLAAAAYFSALKPQVAIRVVESDMAPKTFVAGWFLAKNESAGRNRLGNASLSYLISWTSSRAVTPALRLPPMFRQAA